MVLNKTLLNWSIAVLILFVTSCKSNDSSGAKGDSDKPGNGGYQNTDRYDITKPVIINLPIVLDEISGIAYYPKDTSVFAIVDEEAVFYKIPIMNSKSIKRWVFGKSRDYEDLILRDSSFYVLVSSGDMIKLDFETDTVGTRKTEFGEGSGKKQNEFEAMFVDSGKIITICKDCSLDEKGSISTFIYDDSTNQFKEHFKIDLSPLAESLGKKLKDVKPSAAAINPATGELYILSSVSKHLIILDKDHKVKQVVELNPKLYKQPEGMTFTPAGDLIISNEVFLEGHAQLLILKNKLK